MATWYDTPPADAGPTSQWQGPGSYEFDRDAFGQPLYVFQGNTGFEAKPFDFGTLSADWTRYGQGTPDGKQGASLDPQFASYLNQKYAPAVTAAMTQRNKELEGTLVGSMTKNFNPYGMHPDERVWSEYLRPVFERSGVTADPRWGEYENWYTTGVNNANTATKMLEDQIDSGFNKNVMMGLGAVGGVMGAGALGAFGGGGGVGGLAGGAGEAGWGVMQGLSPETLQALGSYGGLESLGGLSASELASLGVTPESLGLTGAGAAGGTAGGGMNLGSYGPAFDSSVVGSAVSPEAMSAAGAYPMSGTAGSFTSLPTFSTGGANVGFSGAGGGGGGGAAPGQVAAGQQPGVGPGASKALGIPTSPGATAAAGSPVAAGAGAGAGGGGDFLNGILEQFKKNALNLGMMGLSLALTPKDKSEMPAAAQQAVDTTAGARQLGQEYIDAARRGELTAPQAASLERYKQQAKNQVRQYFSSIGQFDSTSRLQAEAQIDETAVAMQQQLIQQTLTNGLNALGVGTGPLQQAAQYQVGQDRRLQEAMGSFARGLGSIFGQGAGQGQTTGGPAPARQAAQQQAPAIMQPQQPAPAQQQSVEPYYDPTAA